MRSAFRISATVNAQLDGAALIPIAIEKLERIDLKFSLSAARRDPAPAPAAVPCRACKLRLAHGSCEWSRHQLH